MYHSQYNLCLRRLIWWTVLVHSIMLLNTYVVIVSEVLKWIMNTECFELAV